MIGATASVRGAAVRRNLPADISIPFSLGFIFLVLTITTLTSLRAAKRHDMVDAEGVA